MKKFSAFQEQVFVRTYRFDEKLPRLKKCGAKDWWRFSWWMVDSAFLKRFWLEKDNVTKARDMK